MKEKTEDTELLEDNKVGSSSGNTNATVVNSTPVGQSVNTTPIGQVSATPTAPQVVATFPASQVNAAPTAPQVVTTPPANKTVTADSNIPVPPAENLSNSPTNDASTTTLIQTDAREVKEEAPKKTFEEVQAEREAARKAREAYQAPPVSKAKYGFTIFLFVVMFALIIFLPKISDYITLMKAKKEDAELGEIVTGTLKCNLRRTSEKYNISYTDEFEFKDSKLTRLVHVVATEGDAILDADDLNLKLEACKTLEKHTKGLAGVNVSCSLSNDTLVESQILNYNLLDKEKVTTAFVEAGGIYPGYVNGQNIDNIEKDMNAASYKCERLR